MPVAKHAGTRLTLCLAALLLGAASAQANNLDISNVSLTGQDTVDNFILVQFDITWDNSWRISGADPDNYDAAWVFVKYRVAGGDWMHATLNTSGHTAPSGSAIDTPGDGKGVFIRRSADGTGMVTFNSVQLRWNYGADGLADNETDVEVQVLGIEMVYVPEGSFELGSGGTETDHFYEHDGTGTPDKTQTYTVSSEAAIIVGAANGNLFYDFVSGGGGDQSGPIPAAFPKGFAAFYIQKYEISQGQYAEFLNLLTSTQAATRDPGADAMGNNRYTITGSHPSFTASAPDRACNFLSWADGAAYADWAGLRPMTELEYEKASRGTRPPVADEFAWGTTNLHASAYTITNDGQPNATISNPGSGTGNASYDVTDGSLDGPLRVGIFAASFAPPSRQEAGASFYGVMEMSGNLHERPVTIGNATGRAYTGTHGDGVLTAGGDADASMWPGTDEVGAGFRGGTWASISSGLRVSGRSSAALVVAPARGTTPGFRAVRSAP
ncbi:MAG: formylglycine-generating enzyme family protein [Acidimicrobiia bacterium]